MNLVWPVPIDVVPAALAEGVKFGAYRAQGTSGPHDHAGIDLGTNDTEVFAAADGIVTKAYVFDAYGGPGIIDIDHEDGAWHTRYLHLDPGSFTVKVGDLVTAGQSLGRACYSGQANCGNHVHFELWQNGTPVDPWPLLQAGGGGTLAGGGLLLPVTIGVGVYLLIKKFKG